MKEIADRLDIQEYRTDPGNSDRGREQPKPLSQATSAIADKLTLDGNPPRNDFAISAAFIAVKNDTLRYEFIFHEACELRARHKDSIGSFNDFNRSRYDKLWRVNVTYVDVGSIFRIDIR